MSRAFHLARSGSDAASGTDTRPWKTLPHAMLNADAPGDTIQRAVTVSNTGNQDFASITLTTAASPSTLLDSDATDGLQMLIERCSVAWTEGGSAPAYTYTCSGSTSTVLISRAIIGSGLALGNLTITSGATNHLRVTVSLPSSAGNTLQGLSSTITYTFTGTQRAGTSR